MSSDVEICNRALSKLGDLRVTSLEDATKPARACNSAYIPVRDALLRSHPWNFATARVSIAALVDAPAHTYANQFQLPSDCLRVRQVETSGLPWTVEGKKILTDAGAPLDIVYTKRETDPETFDKQFIKAFEDELAYEMCEELTQSNTKKEERERAAKRSLISAKLSDAQESSALDHPDDDWTIARR